MVTPSPSKEAPIVEATDYDYIHLKRPCRVLIWRGIPGGDSSGNHFNPNARVM